MADLPSTSTSYKRVKFGNPNFEEQLLKWYGEVNSDISEMENDCDEDVTINSEHDSRSEIEDQSNDNDTGSPQVAPPKETSKYFYGKSRFKWSTNPSTANVGRPRQHNIIVNLPGLLQAAQIGSSADPITIWRLLFSENILTTILQWTNYKIKEEQKKYNNRNSATIQILDITELEAFLCLLIFTSIFKSNDESINTLFASDGTGREIIRCIMNKDRFAFILATLRFDNPEDRIMRRLENPAAPISEIFDTFTKNSQKYFSIGANACVDEMLVGFRGRCRFKMYMPSKPVKYGIKIMCCTDARSGYFYNGYIYTGKDSDGKGLPIDQRKYGKPTQSVLRLAQPLYKTNRNLTFDNWFTSLELATCLRDRGLTCIGTLKRNKREIPPEFLPTKRKQIGLTLYGFTRDFTLLSYCIKRNKSVILLSTMHHNKSEDKERGKPDVIEYYNSKKGGVDSLHEKC